MKAEFEGTLDLRFRKHPIQGKWFITLSTFSYYSKDKEKYTIPVNTNTDFASIPRIFRGIISRSGNHTMSAVFHDWLCEYNIVARKKADKLFLESLEISGVGWIKRRMMYMGVRAYSIIMFKR